MVMPFLEFFDRDCSNGLHPVLDQVVVLLFHLFPEVVRDLLVVVDQLHPVSFFDRVALEVVGRAFVDVRCLQVIRAVVGSDNGASVEAKYKFSLV